jgi:hypothetical protein
MAQYAQFDPAAQSPAPVIGWYDTDEFEYAEMPPKSSLLELTKQQWVAHFDDPNGFAVQDGQLVAKEKA